MTQPQNNRLFNATFLGIALIIGLYVCSACSNKSQVKDAKILVIHSFRDDFVAYPDMNLMIAENLRKKDIQSNIQTFYLDCDNLEEKVESATLYGYVDTMKVKPDVILVTDDQATYSLLSSGHPLLKKIPIVFTGVNFPNWDLLNEYSNVTGIWDKLDFQGNVEMIEKLMGPQRVRLYYDRTYLGRKILADLADQLSSRDKEIYDMIHTFLQNSDTASITKTEYVGGFLKDELLEELDSTTFYFLNLREVTGGKLLWCINGKFNQSVSLLSRYDFTMSRIGHMSSIPTFSVVNKCVGYGQGILGGYFMTVEDQIEEGCDYLAKILQGSAVSTLPVKEGSKKNILDWKEMERWKINKSDVGEDYTIINMPFYVEYQWEVIVFGTLISASIVFVICYLLFLFIRETKRKRIVQQTLREERDFLSLVLEGGNFFAWSYDSEKDEFIFDKEFMLSVGLKTERITLNRIMELTHPDDVEMAITLFFNVLNQKEEKAHVSVRLNFNGIKYVWYEFRMLGVPHRKSNNTQDVIGVVFCVQDLKEREQELIIARDLAAKTELKQSFLANMSHEIRTPLNAIVGFSNLLVVDDELDEDEKREFITTINTNCELLLKLINDILEISRIESGNMSFVLHNCSINRLMDEVYQMNYLTAPSNVSFIKETLAEDLITNTDCTRLKQVLVNFVNNAFKFTTTGQIKLGVEHNKKNNEICLYVQDTGIGIPAEEQAMIFERFYKRNEFAQGTGLGLSICCVIAEKLKGRIILESEEGKGSRFGIVIPCEQDFENEDQEIDDDTTSETTYVVEKDDHIRPVILIAEDSVSNYMVLSRMLKKYYTIIWALNGADALEIINKRSIDLVLMDIKMQEMDGLTALKKIKKRFKNLPVIIQTAYAYDENRETARKAGCANFIEKPIQADVLMKAIEECIDVKRKTIEYSDVIPQ